MAMTGAEVEVRIRAEGADSVARELGQADDATQKFTDKTNKLSGTLQKVGGVGRASFAGLTLPILGMTGLMVDAASDQGEAWSKTNVVFGDSAKTIQDWSNTSATSMGLSKTAYLDAAGSLGNLYTGMGMSQEAAAGMSNDTLQLAADLASFNNVPFPEALAAIQSGLVGEAEPLRRFGVLLTEDTVKAKAMEMGLVDANGEISEQNKVLARNQLIMEQTGNAQGDFTRTSDGLANQQRILRAQLANLSAEMGTVLVPVVTAVVGKLTGFITKLSGMSDGAKTFIVVAGLIAAAIGPILIGISMMLPALGMLGTVFGVLLGPVGLVIAALVALGIAYKTNFLGFGDAVRAVASKVAAGFGNIVDFVKRAANIFGQFNSKTNPVRAGLLTLVALFPRLAGVIQPIIFAVERFTATFTGLMNAGVNPVTAALRAMGSAIPGLAGTFGHLAEAASAVLDAFRALMSGDIRGFFSNIAEAAMESAKALLTSYKEVGQLILAGLKAIPWGDAWRGIQNAWDAIPWGTMASRGLSLLMAGLRAGSGMAAGAFSWLSDAVSSALQNMSDAVQVGLQLAWNAISSINWSDYIPDLVWDGFVAAVDLAKKVGSFAWDTFITAVDLAKKVGAFAWDTFVTAVDLGKKVGAFAWDTFVTAVDLGKKVGAFAWDTFVTAVDLGKKVGSFAWSTFVTAVDLSAKVGAFLWSTFVTAVDLTAKVGAFAWDTFVTAVDLSAKVGAFAWDTFVTAVDLSKKVGAFAWTSFVVSVDLAKKVGAFAWSSFVVSVDLAKKVGAFAWSTFVTGIDLTKKVLDLLWTDFVPDVAWSSFIPQIDWSSIIPEFPGWPDMTGWLPDIPDFPGWGSLGDLFGASAPQTGFNVQTMGTGNQGGDMASRVASGGATPKTDIPTPARMTIPAPDISGFIGAIATAQAAVVTFVAASISVLGGLTGGISTMVGTISGSLSGLTGPTMAAQTAFIGMVTAIVSVMGGLTGGISTMVATVSGQLTGLSGPTSSAQGYFISFVAATIGVMGGWVGGISTMVDTVSSTLQTRTSTATNAARTSFTTFVSTVIGVMGGWTSGISTMVNTVSTTLQTQIRTATTQASSSFREMQSNATTSMNGMRSSVQSAMSGIQSSISSGMSTATGAIRSNAGQWAGILSSQAGAMRSAGVAVGSAAGEGVAAGMRAAAGAVRAAANEIIAEVDRAMRAKAQIKSPSRLLAVVGRFLTWGLARGMVAVDRVRELRRNAGVLTDTVRDELTRKLSTGLPTVLTERLTDNLIPTLQTAVAGRTGHPSGSQGYVPVPVPPNRGGQAQTWGGNTYIVMTRSELLDLFDTVDAVKVMTDPVEQRAIFGGQ